MRERTVDRHVRGIPEESWRRLKAEAAALGITAGEAVTRSIESWLYRQRIKRKQKEQR